MVRVPRKLICEYHSQSDHALIDSGPVHAPDSWQVLISRIADETSQQENEPHGLKAKDWQRVTIESKMCIPTARIIELQTCNWFYVRLEGIAPS